MAYTKGTNFFVDSFDTNVSVAFVNSSGLAYFAKCTGTPPTTTNLYQIGCIMIQEDGTSNILWSNVGTATTPNWIASANAAGTRYTKTAITSTQILNFFGTPVTIVAAAGLTKALVVDGVVLEMVRSSTAYTQGGEVTLCYELNNTQATSGSIAASVFLGAAGSSTAVLGPLILAGSAAAQIVPKNSALILKCGSGAYLSGTGSAVAHVWYRVVDVRA